MIGPTEATVVALLMIGLFGVKRIPRLGNSLGETVGYIRAKTTNKIE